MINVVLQPIWTPVGHSQLASLSAYRCSGRKHGRKYHPPRSWTRSCPSRTTDCWSPIKAALSLSLFWFWGLKTPMRLKSPTPAAFAMAFWTSSMVAVRSTVRDGGSLLTTPFRPRLARRRVTSPDIMPRRAKLIRAGGFVVKILLGRMTVMLSGNKDARMEAVEAASQRHKKFGDAEVTGNLLCKRRPMGSDRCRDSSRASGGEASTRPLPLPPVDSCPVSGQGQPITHGSTCTTLNLPAQSLQVLGNHGRRTSVASLRCGTSILTYLPPLKGPVKRVPSWLLVSSRPLSSRFEIWCMRCHYNLLCWATTESASDTPTVDTVPRRASQENKLPRLTTYLPTIGTCLLLRSDQRLLVFG